MSTSYPRRPVRKRTDLMTILLMLVSVVALPVVGLVGWKMYKSGGVLAIGKKPPVESVAHQPAHGSGTRTGGKGSKPGGNEMAMNDLPEQEQKTFQLGGSDEVPSGADDYTGQGNGTGRRSRRQRGFAEGADFRAGGNGGGGGRMSMGHSMSDVPKALQGVESVLGDALAIPKKVLVVWLFDRTASCQSLRQEVANQLPAMYKRLNPTGEGGDATLLTMVGQFGADFNFITESPEANADNVQKAVGNISTDDGFVENTFGAIKAATDKIIDYRKKKGRFVTLVVVTDEVGNDRLTIDEVLPKLTPYGIPVQVVGPSALFGTVEGFNRLAEGEPKPGEVRVMQGPDSHDVDWIHLDSPGGMFDPSSIETGIGPYHLARLCRETDGNYFVLTHGGSPLKGFEPQYVSEAEYQKQVESNKARSSLIKAAQLSRAEVLHNFSTSFDNSDEVRRNRALDAAQKPVAKVMMGVDSYIDALKPGEPDLAKLTAPGDKRWRVAFELAYARAAAAKSRHQGFLEMTGQMKGGRKFQDPNHHFWVLKQVDDPMNVSVLDKMASKSRDYLNHIVKDYAGTPWAQSAEREMSAKMSWKWFEE
ncbi:MAG: VWA domain-containing protein [Planctomycetes bacterium]|nr:VWA domain-containing protein [Planctomycetota bacterium]